MEAARAHVAEMEQRRDAQQRDLRDLQGDIDAAQQLSSHETERLHRQELALGRIRADLSQLSDRLWNTYELSYAERRKRSGSMTRARQGKAPRTANPYPRPLTKTPPTRRRAASANCVRQMGSVNVGAIEEYAQMYERFTDLSAQRTDLERAKKDLSALIAQLLEQMETVFVRQFSTLQEYFSETFTRLRRRPG